MSCGGAKGRHSLPYRLHKETSPWRPGLFLETRDACVSAGLFLELLLTSSDMFQCARFCSCLESRKLPPPSPPLHLKCIPGFKTKAQMQTSGGSLLVFSLEAWPPTGRQCEHSKQRAGSLKQPLTRSRLLRPNRLFPVSSVGPLWAPGCRSERRVLGWPFGSILTHLHFPFTVMYDGTRIHPPEVSDSVGRAE